MPVVDASVLTEYLGDAEGAEVALVDPTLVRTKGPTGSSPLPPTGAAR